MSDCDDYTEHLKTLNRGGWDPTSIPGRNADTEFLRWIEEVRQSAFSEDTAAAEAEIERQRALIDNYLPTIITALSDVVYNSGNVYKAPEELTPEEVGMRAALSAAHHLAKEFADPAIGHQEPLYPLPDVQDLLRTRKDGDRKAAVRALQDAAEDVVFFGVSGIQNAKSPAEKERLFQEWLTKRAERIGREQN